MDSPATTALVVDPSPAETVFLVSSLSELGFRVIASDNFRDAKARLLSTPALLISELRLGEYNGLHLVFRAKSIRPDMAAIVRTHIADPVLQSETESMGATFVMKNTSASELRAAICRTLLRRPGSTEPIRPPFERRAHDRREIHGSLVGQPDRRVRERRLDVTSIIRRESHY